MKKTEEKQARELAEVVYFDAESTFEHYRQEVKRYNDGKYHTWKTQKELGVPTDKRDARPYINAQTKQVFERVISLFSKLPGAVIERFRFRTKLISIAKQIDVRCPKTIRRHLERLKVAGIIKEIRHVWKGVEIEFNPDYIKLKRKHTFVGKAVSAVKKAANTIKDEAKKTGSMMADLAAKITKVVPVSVDNFGDKFVDNLSMKTDLPLFSENHQRNSYFFRE